MTLRNTDQLVNTHTHTHKARKEATKALILTCQKQKEKIPIILETNLRKAQIPSTLKKTTYHCFPSVQACLFSAMIPTLALLLAFLTFQIWIVSVSGDVPVSLCRSYCGNLTIDYPFALRPGCGHPGFRDLLFCINGMLMFHITSGSYRVLDIDYAYKGLILHDHGMSDCYSLIRTASGSGNGFVVEPWRAPYLEPAPDNVFMLLGCRAESPLFQGFPSRHLPCRNVSGMGCDEYYACPAWGFKPRGRESAYGLESPPPCCSVPFGAVRAINLSHLGCEGYSSAYSLAPLRPEGPGVWSYGIRVSYSVPADHNDFCRACQATGGLCGFDAATQGNMCLCEGWNSTSNCDSGKSLGRCMEQTLSLASLFGGLLVSIITQILSSV